MTERGTCERSTPQGLSPLSMPCMPPVTVCAEGVSQMTGWLLRLTSNPLGLTGHLSSISTSSSLYRQTSLTKRSSLFMAETDTKAVDIFTVC